MRKLWSYFIPKPPPKKTLAALKKRYRKGYAIRPLVEAILLHPALYEGPRMIKPPIVQIAGLLRGRESGIWTDSWTWLAGDAGQLLFDPPNVSGWDEERWLDTARLSGRWNAAARITDAYEAEDDGYPVGETAKQAVSKAHRFWGRPTLSPRTEKELMRFARQVEALVEDESQMESYWALRQNALRMLIATSPDFQTS